MKNQIISVTEAARNFADCINRARYQRQTFVLVKNGVPVATLGPATPPVCRGSDLAAAVAAGGLSPEEAAAWRRDLESARKDIKPPVDRWQ